MFRASARLAAPDGLSVEDLRKTLERLAGEMMVDIAVSEGEDSAGTPPAK
jgi:glycine cleavage system regulatory protein